MIYDNIKVLNILTNIFYFRPVDKSDSPSILKFYNFVFTLKETAHTSGQRVPSLF